MSLLDELLPASYGGVPFLMTISSTTGGRKDVLKEFVNSNLQSIEDLGLIPRPFDIEGAITANTAGEQYKQNRDRLIAVLEAGRAQKFIHPIEGAIENIRVRSFTLIENFNSLGDGKLSISFAPDNTTGQPIVETTSITDVFSQGSSIRSATVVDFVNRYKIPSSGNNFSAALNKTNEIVNAFADNITFLSVASDVIDEFSAQLSELSANVINLVSLPQEFADSVNNLFITTSNLYNTPENAFDVLARFFQFGEGDEGVENTTPSRIEREATRRTTNALVNILSLTHAYEQSSSSTFVTVDDIDTAADQLEAQYQIIVSNNSSDINTIFAEDGGVSIETIDLLTDLRSTVQSFFDDQKLTAKQIITVNTVILPARVLAFDYFGSSEQGEAIAELNNTTDVTFLEGDVEIFTA